MFDITDPKSPAIQSYVVTSLQPDGCTVAAALGGGFFALTCDAPNLAGTGPGTNGSLILVDARNPQSPAYSTYATIEGIYGLATAGGYLYAATSAGVNVYRVQLP